MLSIVGRVVFEVDMDRELRFNSIYWLQNAVFAEKPFNSHEIGDRLIQLVKHRGLRSTPSFPNHQIIFFQLGFMLRLTIIR